MGKLTLEIGKVYRSRDGDTVSIVSEITEDEPCFEAGFRFRDHNGESYKANGQWSFVDKKKLGKDLVELVE